ncbi:MAG TPA: translocation/assembly module TamB domain-containing protein, partial [Mangrovimonas sp.]|nr:translocation/assembly module TamB domain-containing protein [Mangrovimonas sp.]
FVRSEFVGGKTNKDVYNLNLYHTFNKNNKSVIGLKHSDVTFRNNTWQINKNRDTLNKIEFDKGFKNIDISRILMNHENEQIELSGILKDSTYKDIHLNFKDVDLAKITPEIDSLSLQGNVNGKLDISQKNGTILPNSSITIDDLDVNNTYLGSFSANIKGDESLTRYDVDIKIKDEVTPTLSAQGVIDVGDETSFVDVFVDFDNFNLEPLNPFGGEVISNIRGLATGEVHVNGNLKRPNMDGELLLNQAGMLIPYLNVDLSMAPNSSVKLEQQSFVLGNINITDTAYNTKGKLKGRINHKNFSNWDLDLALSTDKLLVLNTEDSEDALYYGTGFIKGDATISGPAEQLVIAVNATTMPGTDFKIPLNDTESFGDNTFIKFLSPEEKLATQQGIDLDTKQISGLELDFDLDITQDAQIELVLDKASGSTIKGKGVGALLIDINTNGKFNIYGDFSVFEGEYNFLYGGIIQKQFRVKPGSSLSWDGDPLGAR